MEASELRLLREGRGLSQLALATLIGVEQSTVARWEQGAKPRETHARALASALGISVDDLDAQA